VSFSESADTSSNPVEKAVDHLKISCCLVLALNITALAEAADEQAIYERTADKHGFTVFMQEGGWCWYQDPRAIAHRGKLFIGSVRGNGNGEALVGIYDLQAKRPVGAVTMHSRFDKDDHNSPVFHARKNGSVLAVYARHGHDLYHYSRISDRDNPMQWSDESRHSRRLSGERDKVSYMNLCFLEKEGLLYNFFRGIEYNPTFVTSPDEGSTWSEPVHFFKSDMKGRHRPYARYATNGKDTVYVSVTDGHPRDFGNSIYYFEFRNGRYYRADGTVIKDLAEDGPILPGESDLVYEGSMTTTKPKGHESVPGAAWTSSIAIDAAGRPHIAYSLYLSNDDHRYRLASWDGAKWIDREVAYAGKCLYPSESSYTGLITLDPSDPTVVFISTDVNPASGKENGGPHEVYRARITAGDDSRSIKWEPVTKESPVRNIRPVIVRNGKRRIVLWNRGDFKTYKDYQLDTVGFIENAEE
jgi:hypothetical protein